METDLYKTRTVPACIGAAYILLTTNFKAIFRHTWLPILLCSLVGSSFLFLNMPDKTLYNWGMAHPLTVISAIYAMAIIILIIEMWVFSCVANLLNGNGMRKNLARSGNIFLFAVVMIIVLGAFAAGLCYVVLAGKQNPVPLVLRTVVTLITTMGVLFLIFIVAVLPFDFSMYKYQIDHTTPVRNVFTKDYVTGFKRWWFIFGVGVLMDLILLVVGFIVSIPSLIITLGQTINQLGIMDGDPSGVPVYFPYLMIAVNALLSFLAGYVGVWAILAMAYCYGSIEASEKGKTEQQTIQTKHYETSKDTVHRP